MSFVPESVKQQLELCKGTGVLDFGKTGLTEIPEQVGEQAAIEGNISHLDLHGFSPALCSHDYCDLHRPLEDGEWHA
jgi:hypothetical protein